MIYRFTLTIIMCLLSLPAVAQEVHGKDFEERLSLAESMHDIWPVRVRVEQAIEAVSLQIPPEERLKFKSAMRKAIKFKQLEEESERIMAETFSLKELEAMVNFYGSVEGRAVTAKLDDYQTALEPVITKMLDKALLDLKIGAQN